MAFSMTRGDLLPAIGVTAIGPDGAVVSLAGATARFIMRRAGEVAKVSAAAAITSPASAGHVKYDWVSGDTDTAGAFLAQFEIDFGGGELLTLPGPDVDGSPVYLDVFIAPDLDGTLPAAGTATAPETCILYGTVYRAGATPRANALVRVRISPGLVAAAGTGFHVSETQSTYTAVDGSWTLTLPRGEDFRLEIPAAGVDAVGTVPNAATADLSTVTLDPYRGSAPPLPLTRWY